jgi:O-antigen/teichoic acid export membrane protein
MMSENYSDYISVPTGPILKQKEKIDFSGRDRFTSNLIYGWGGYIVVIVAEFIIPRLIGQALRQSKLGICDFSWSFVNYLNLAMPGLGSSINRYVAKYRAPGDSERLDLSVSTVFYLQLVITILVLLSAGVLCWFTPWLLLLNSLGKHTATAQWTVALWPLLPSIWFLMFSVEYFPDAIDELCTIISMPVRSLSS